LKQDGDILRVGKIDTMMLSFPFDGSGGQDDQVGKVDYWSCLIFNDPLKAEVHQPCGDESRFSMCWGILFGFKSHTGVFLMQKAADKVAFARCPLPSPHPLL
jgi:hypothetical protein